MPNYNRYSHHARRALTHAGLLTQQYGHPRIGTGHLLVGVMLTEGSIGYQVLYALNLSVERARPHLKTLLPASAPPSDLAANSETLNIALELAEDESSRLGHHYVGTEHLLLGITRTNVGNAPALLHLMNGTPEQVRRRVRRTIKDGATEFNLQNVKNNARLSELSRRVISAAEQMSVSLDHQTVGLGHLLLVLLRERRSYISTLLRDFGLDEGKLQQDLNEHNPALLVSIEVVLGKVLDQVGKLGSHYTGTDHLLLTLCIDPAGVAMLTAYGVPPEQMRLRVEEHIQQKR